MVAGLISGNASTFNISSIFKRQKRIFLLTYFVQVTINAIAEVFCLLTSDGLLLSQHAIFRFLPFATPSSNLVQALMEFCNLKPTFTLEKESVQQEMTGNVR